MPVPDTAAKPTQDAALAPVRDHALTLENRRSLTVSGVSRILSYDEASAALVTPLGNLTVGGQGLQVSELSVRTGQVHISGTIEYLQYTENRESAGGLLSRLLR